jgi:hypothetical protein
MKVTVFTEDYELHSSYVADKRLEDGRFLDMMKSKHPHGG